MKKKTFFKLASVVIFVVLVSIGVSHLVNLIVGTKPSAPIAVIALWVCLEAAGIGFPVVVVYVFRVKSERGPVDTIDSMPFSEGWERRHGPHVERITTTRGRKPQTI